MALRNLNQFVDMIHLYNITRYGEIVLTCKCLDEDWRLFEVEEGWNEVEIGNTLRKYQLMFEDDKFCLTNMRDSITKGKRYKFVIEPLSVKRRFKFYRYTMELI